LRDRSGIVQAVYEGDLPIKVHIEAVIRLRGKVAHEPKAPQGVELRLGVDGIEIMTDLEETPPFEVGLAKLNAGLEIILKHRAYSLRNEKLHAVFLIQAEIIEGFRAFLRSQHFLEITTPKLVASGTEGGSELFAVQYFEQPAFLAQSPQLYKQMMVGAGYERVFEVGKAYRAEEHNTARHIKYRSFSRILPAQNLLLSYISIK
jgi:nondiscriminating aspartyl-tRNA synthetase